MRINLVPQKKCCKWVQGAKLWWAPYYTLGSSVKSDKLSSIVSREVMINLEIPIKHISYLYFNFKITFEKGIKMLSILTRRANTSNAMNEAEMAQELLRGGMQDLHKCCYPFKSMLKTTKKIGSRYSYCLHCRK